MPYQHQLDPSGERSKAGDDAEILFMETCQKKGIYCAKASDYANCMRHTDFFCKRGDVKFTTDVKAPKKVNGVVSNKLVWVEFRTKGNAGWLYGKEDFCSLLLPKKDKFLMVFRSDLRKMAEKLCVGYAQSMYDAFHKRLIRKTLNKQNKVKYDEIGLVSYEDIFKYCRYKILSVV